MTKRKASSQAAAGQQLEKKRKVTGDVGTVKTSGSKAAGPELPGTSGPVATAGTIASPKDGHIEDQKPAELSKDAASVEESSGSPVTPEKDRVVDPKSSASKAAGPELPGAITGDITDSDKGKAAGPKLCGTSNKRSAMEAGFEGKSEVKKTRRVPVGLFNHHRACFVNAVTQCLRGTAPIDGYYRRKARGVLANVTNCGVTEGDLRKMKGSNTRQICSRKDLVREAFRGAAGNISLSAYFGELCDRMSTTTEPSISPFIFQQALGSQITSGEGRPMDGEHSEDSNEFLTSLLDRLKAEELASRTTGTDEPTVVQKTFGVETAKKVACKACQHEHSNPAHLVSLPASIPRQKKPLTLEECFSSFEDRNEPSDYKCSVCGKADSTEMATSIVKSHDHLILNIVRVDLIGKNPTTISIPQGPIDLAAWFLGSESQDTQFEVYGVVRHHGSKNTDGHYDAIVKIEGQWWHLDDHRVSSAADAVLTKPQPACQIFLRRLSS